MRNKSPKTKKNLKMGTGTGADYRPWIEVGEFGSLGTAGRITDWKTGRVVHLLSQTEIYFWYVLRWNDNILDIREQYPLELDTTEKIANEFGIKHPAKNGKSIVMTTDMLVTTKNGDIALSIKRNENLSERTIEKLYLERQYWLQKNIPWKLITIKDFNMVTARNIRDIVAFYNVTYFQDRISFLKFLVARKYIQIDINKELDWKELCNTYSEEILRFEKLNIKSLEITNRIKE